MDRRLLAADHLHHHLKQGREQQGARVLSLSGALEPRMHLLRIEAALEHRPGHGGDGEVFGKATQDRVEQCSHEGASVGKMVNLTEVKATFKALFIETCYSIELDTRYVHAHNS
jgi:hypothetical protein